MQLENSFTVEAPPDRVFAYLLDVNKVVGCVPGAELTEVVDESTFHGKVKIKVGPITVAYSGTARITGRDDAARSATLEGQGRETTGQDSARASAVMKVNTAGEASVVTITTEYSVAGRVAQFGRGVMEDVARRIVHEMATCIQANLQSDEPAEDDVAAAVAQSGEAPRRPQGAVTTAKPVSAFSMIWHIVKLRVGRLFGRSA